MASGSPLTDLERAYGAHADHIVPTFDLCGLIPYRTDGDLEGLLDAPPQDYRVRARCRVLYALLDQLGRLVLEDGPKVYLLSDGYVLVGDGRREQGLVQDHVLALRP